MITNVNSTLNIINPEIQYQNVVKNRWIHPMKEWYRASSPTTRIYQRGPEMLSAGRVERCDQYYTPTSAPPPHRASVAGITPPSTLRPASTIYSNSAATPVAKSTQCSPIILWRHYHRTPSCHQTKPRGTPSCYRVFVQFIPMLHYTEAWSPFHWPLAAPYFPPLNSSA